MRALTSAVLVMEAIMLGLAIPVVLVARGQPDSAGWVLTGLALACLLLPAFAKRRFYLPVGWALQAGVIACGVYEGFLFFLGAIFAALWWTAIWMGHKTAPQGAPVDAGA